MRRVVACLVFGFLVTGALQAGPVSMTSAHAQTKSFGCFKIVNASSVRIRKRPYLWSKTLGYAKRGRKVVKNRRFCSVRTTWCRVRKGKISGWVGRKFLKKVSC